MRHTLIALVEDRPGAMNRLLGLLRGRGLAVHSIAFGESETPGVKRTTVLVDTENVDQTMKQLNRLIEVLEVTDVTHSKFVVRETALVKIQAAEARRAESAVAQGESLGPLHGVPIALKDELWTEGIASTAGSLLFERFVPSRDGTVAQRRREGHPGHAPADGHATRPS